MALLTHLLISLLSFSSTSFAFPFPSSSSSSRSSSFSSSLPHSNPNTRRGAPSYAWDYHCNPTYLPYEYPRMDISTTRSDCQHLLSALPTDPYNKPYTFSGSSSTASSKSYLLPRLQCYGTCCLELEIGRGQHALSSWKHVKFFFTHLWGECRKESSGRGFTGGLYWFGTGLDIEARVIYRAPTAGGGGGSGGGSGARGGGKPPRPPPPGGRPILGVGATSTANLTIAGNGPANMTSNTISEE